MIELKAGVRVLGIRPEIHLIWGMVEGIWLAHGVKTLVVTAVIDGKHKRQSFHYSGVATDFRINTMAPEQRATAVVELGKAVGPDYVILHESIGLPEEHVHAHFLPAEAY